MKKAPVLAVGGINVSQHTLPTYTIALGAAVTLGAETASLQLSNPPVGVTSISLEAGTILSFPGATINAPRVLITLAADVTVTTTAAAKAILPAPAAIADTLTATTKALNFLPGCRSAIVTPTIKTEDVTNYLSGTGMEMLVVGNSKKVSMEVDLVYNNVGHDALLAMMYADADVGREAYLDILFPSGERHEGYALLTTATPAGGVQAKRAITAEWQFQGGCYTYTPAPLVAA
jgi:hypothetical protein